MIGGAPRPVAPFSHAVRAGDFLFVTGQMPTDPVTHEVVGEDVETQTRQVMANLSTVLAGAGTTLSRTVFARVYLTEFQRDYAAMNALWETYFEVGKRPARTCVGVTGLAVGALVEIDLVVAL
ncbi:RidA family protein [Acuticoccus sp. 2012]|uniref:RidA family protein n=2 Tax=Acuticoccus mangrovi TaxID=2796142 RepID=A0A934IRQ7_9HYPH|nr:RidA family protein [Acuticoccus mangrovi]